MKTRPCKVSMEGGEPLSPAVGLSEIIYLRSVPRFPSWKRPFSESFAQEGMEGSIAQWIWLREEDAVKVPGEGEQLHSSLELNRDEAMIAERFRGTTRCAGYSQGWGRGRKGVCRDQGQDSALAARTCSDGSNSSCGGVWLGELGWVRAGAISRDILPPRLVPLAVVTVILKRHSQLHPLYLCPGCGPQKINVTSEKRLR